MDLAGIDQGFNLDPLHGERKVLDTGPPGSPCAVNLTLDGTGAGDTVFLIPHLLRRMLVGIL